MLKLIMLSFLACSLAFAQVDDSSLFADDNFMDAEEESKPIDYFVLGKEQVEKNNFQAAIDNFEKAVEKNPNNVDALVEWARALVMVNRRKDGLLKLEQALKTATRLSDRERIVQQRKLLSEIFYTNSTFQKYQNGLNQMKLRKVSAAIEALEQALSKEPNNVAILRAYAKALSDSDDWNENIKVLEQAFLLNPDNQQIRLLLGEALLEKNPERTAFLLKPLAIDKKNTEHACLLYVKALDRLGKFKKASQILKANVDTHSDRLLSVFWLGKLYAKKKDGYWLARKYLLTFLRREEKHVDKKQYLELKKEANRLLQLINKDLGLGSA